MNRSDFSQGSIPLTILRLAIPLTIAQIVNVLYNIVDRIFIGHIPETGTLALTGLGLCFPVITIVMAFANLVGMGGSPLFSIERGKGNDEQAQRIMSNSFTMLMIFGISLTVIGLIIRRPVLYLFGASDATIVYADAYIRIYLLGTIFVMLGLGMNFFINAQGFSIIGMLTVIIGAVTNIILDYIFIFILHMGVSGAALATVMSQFVSCVWILQFLTGHRTLIRLSRQMMPLDSLIVKRIIGLGMSGFVMQITNSLVQIACNSTLSQFGGDLYVGVMTVLNSVREVVQMPVNGITNGTQPVLSFNYGASKPKRVMTGIKFMTIVCLAYTFGAWAIVSTHRAFFISIFNNDKTLIAAALPALWAYFFGFFMMSFQFAGQTVFVGLGKSKNAVFFSIFRKVVIVVPLTLILPRIGLGVMGVFWAEPISNFIGGAACYLTMLLTVGRELRAEIAAQKS